MTTLNQARPVTYDVIRKLMQPAAWAMAPEAVEARRRKAERLLGRPFPKMQPAGQKVFDLVAGAEAAMLDALGRGYAPHVAKL